MKPLRDLIEEIEAQLQYEKEHPVITFFKNVFWRWPVHRLPTIMKDIYYNVVYFFQRIKRGFSDYDFFETDVYITTSIANILDYFLKHHHGAPLDMNYDEFNEKLKKLISAFKRYNELDYEEIKEKNKLTEIKMETGMSNDEYYLKSDEIAKKYNLEYDKVYETMTELFKDGFIRHLWD